MNLLVCDKWWFSIFNYMALLQCIECVIEPMISMD